MARSDKGRPIIAKGAGVRRNRSGEATRTKILDAAEAIFAEKGVQAASLREIMIAAGVNIASVNYYFGSKTELLRAVVWRRSEIINAARLKRLDDAKQRSGGVPSIEDWVHALVDPFIEAERSSDVSWRNFLRVMNWVATTRNPECQEIVSQNYTELRAAFIGALSAALPGVGREELAWRYHCVVAILRSCLAERERTAALSQGDVDPDDFEQMLDYVMPFLVAGLSRPSTARRRVN